MHEVESPEVSGYTCPECGGPLWELLDGGMLRFRCRVGHAYTADSLASEQTLALEGALWSALNALEENAAPSRRMAARAMEHGHNLTARRLDERAENAETQARLLRDVLHRSAIIDPTAAVPDVVERAEAPESAVHPPRGATVRR